MSGQSKISARQLMILTTLYTVGSAILIIPSGMAFVAKQDAWLAALAGVGGGPLILYLYIKITSLYPQMTLMKSWSPCLANGQAKPLAFCFLQQFLSMRRLRYYFIREIL
ncbi:GerAB/ArcD/ProY family transporter [Paenibacillus sp. UY79]|nr:GerAB/ArcD/ProY family transporter [Paenibacillus farraposensis]